MKTTLLISICLAFLILGQARIFDELGFPETTTAFHINTNNNLETELESIRVRVFIPELGIVLGSNTFDLPKGETKGQFIEWGDDQLLSGEYTIRVTASNDEFRRVRHRRVIIP